MCPELHTQTLCGQGGKVGFLHQFNSHFDHCPFLNANPACQLACHFLAARSMVWSRCCPVTCQVVGAREWGLWAPLSFSPCLQSHHEWLQMQSQSLFFLLQALLKGKAAQTKYWWEEKKEERSVFSWDLPRMRIQGLLILLYGFFSVFFCTVFLFTACSGRHCKPGFFSRTEASAYKSLEHNILTD